LDAEKSARFRRTEPYQSLRDRNTAGAQGNRTTAVSRGGKIAVPMDRPVKKRVVDDEGTHVLNVDLEVFSREPLDKLVAAFGEAVDVLYVGKWGRRYAANLEVGGSGDQVDAERLMHRFIAIVRNLPSSQRRLWNGAQSREFNVGIEAAARSEAFELKLQPKTLKAINSVGGTLVVTVYAAERLAARRSVLRRSKGSPRKER
jgi:hypothetical protein